MNTWLSLSIRFRRGFKVLAMGVIAGALIDAPPIFAEEVDALDSLEQQFDQEIKPFLAQYCAECHSPDRDEAEIDLTAFASVANVRARVDIWQRVNDVFHSQQMPPKDSPQPTDRDRATMQAWIDGLLTLEAKRLAGDPGPILLRRLSNAEYTNSIQALTAIDSLQPAREFPVDGASGEGFTNAGNALVMSPSLLTKYLDAGKQVAEHAVLLPTGIRFSESTSRRDWTEETLTEIRKLYAKYSAADGGTEVNLQGIVFSTNDGGRLPIAAYLRATIEERASLAESAKSFEVIAQQRGLSAKYLRLLWQGLNSPQSQILRQLSNEWKVASIEDVPRLVADIQRWQQSLWKFSSVGHIGKVNGPAAWMEPVTPVVTRQEFRSPLPAANPETGEVVFYLAVNDAGDGAAGDLAIWERPRLVAAGRPDLLLKDCRRISQSLLQENHHLLDSIPQVLAAADWVMKHKGESPVDTAALASQFQCDETSLLGWFQYLGIGSGQSHQIEGHLSRTMAGASGYDFVGGWVGDDALSVVANSSDTHVRIPGNLPPHSIAVHPSPTIQVAIGWASPIDGVVRIGGTVQHAHPECGNGVVWSLQLRRGHTLQTLASGVAQGGGVVDIDVTQSIAVNKDDVLCLVISPGDGNHSCDLTGVQLVINEVASGAIGNDAELRVWNLAKDVSNDILAGNPHSDQYQNAGVWNFFGEPTTGATGPVIPTGSLLARWQASGDSSERAQLAEELAHLIDGKLNSGDANAVRTDADVQLVNQLKSLGGPLMAATLRRLASESNSASKSIENPQETTLGFPADRFGTRPDGTAVEPASLCVTAPSVIEIRLPASLVEGAEFVTSGLLADPNGVEGSVQMSISNEAPSITDGLTASGTEAVENAGPWTSSGRVISYQQPVIVSNEGTARQRIEASFAEYRDLFPAALCYSKIVPVDEVVTLTLYHREDEVLRRLMLSDSEIQTLDRLWSELHFISRDALALVDAYEQLWQYATQDADPSAFEPLRQPILDRAAAYRQQRLDVQPVHVQAVVEFARHAFRRPLTDKEVSDLHALYANLIVAEVDHEAAIRLLLARILVSPAFLYRMEAGDEETLQIADGEIQMRRLSDHELATRISYFLTASPPDDALLALADRGDLHDAVALDREAERLLQSSLARNLATEFGCQWLHIYDFASHDEKSDAAFPTFTSLRGDMYEESIRFWLDLMQRDLSVLQLLDGDYVIVNEALSKHYEIPWSDASTAAVLSTNESVGSDEAWRRIEGVRKYGRGGILAQASTLSKQSGASRTSPILRGNWVTEVLLGDKLPKPPLNVPVLPETPPAGLNERELIEQHSSDPACAKCHYKIDPYGFALEGFDGIGRRRDPKQHDTSTILFDGTKVDGLDDLRKYISETRRDDFLKQFCRKLLGYSLGRAVQLSDKPLLDEMLTQLHSNDYRFSAAVKTILHSQQFQYVRVDVTNK